MSDRSHVDEVVSGRPYAVTSVNDRPPERFEDFFARPVVSVTAVAGERVVTFRGPSRRDGSSVVVYEKDNSGVGKDVRIWWIARHNGRFEAVERSIY